MSAESSLGRVYESIVAEFAADGEGTAVVFGKRESAKQINQGVGRANRVVVEPRNGSTVGSFAPPRFPTGNPKTVASFLPSATLFIWAVDLAKPNDELAQYEAITALQRRVVAAVFRAAHGSFSLGQATDVAKSTERVLGTEWAIVLTLNEQIYDLPTPVAAVSDSETTYELDAPPGP